jgi:hypothetical protein
MAYYVLVKCLVSCLCVVCLCEVTVGKPVWLCVLGEAGVICHPYDWHSFGSYSYFGF